MDRLDAFRTIKSDPALKDTIIIALTSHVMDGDERKATEAGCDGYISKPIDTRAFLEPLKKHLAV